MVLQDSHPLIVGLRGGALFTSATGLIVFIWSLNEHGRGVVFDEGAGNMNVIVLGTISYAFIWSLAILAVRLLMQRVHPGVYIAFDMIAWLANIIGASMTVAVLGPLMAGGYNCRLQGCQGDLLMRVEVFGYVVVYMNAMFHLILTVWACWACHWERRNMAKP